MEEVAVEPLQVDEVGAGRLGHPQAGAAAGRGAATEEPIRAVAQVAPDEPRVGVEAAVGEHDRRRAQRRAPVGDDAGDGAVGVVEQLVGARAGEDVDAALARAGLEDSEREVRATVAPGVAVGQRPLGQQDRPDAAGRVAAERHPLGAQPRRRRARGVGDRVDQLHPDLAVRAAQDAAADLVGLGVQLGVGDVHATARQRAVAARRRVGRGVEQRHPEPGLRGDERGDAPGEAGAGDDDVVRALGGAAPSKRFTARCGAAPRPTPRACGRARRSGCRT